MKKILFLMMFTLCDGEYLFCQFQPYPSYPFVLYGPGLNGSLYQIFALYADVANGVIFEAPLDADNNKLPFSFSWRGNDTSLAALHISSDGKVGIGTVHPSGTLHIKGKESSEIKLESNAGNAHIKQSQTNLSFYNNGEWLTILNNGRIGIGTLHPTSRLTVAGDIRAREVKVEANAGADFVFADDYRLRPLQEVEQFIAANKHLPDIAPADSMVQNGVNMGEMQIQLLQKIEELTLYTIRQQRQIEALTEQVEKLMNNEKDDQ